MKRSRKLADVIHVMVGGEFLQRIALRSELMHGRENMTCMFCVDAVFCKPCRNQRFCESALFVPFNSERSRLTPSRIPQRLCKGFSRIDAEIL